ncbi:MAG: 6-phosphofructokinase [Clostridia bacterium]|nr:6-phosphofructokinase [Clostridia bacterium]
MRRIGLLTSGGDCQGLNAALRGVAKAMYAWMPDTEIYGFRNGYQGLITGNCNMMKSGDFSGILTLGGTILGTSRQPFKTITVKENENDPDKVESMLGTYRKLGLDAMVILGGNGTHKTANLLRENGMRVVTLPKTIDNDVWGTDLTFGFQSAVDIATHVIDNIHSTAMSHSRVFIIELMGHDAGWLTLYAGIAGGADVILLPEIPYRLKSVCETIESRIAQGKNFSIIALAEGAMDTREAELSKKEFRAKRAAEPYPSIGYRLAQELLDATGRECRVTVPGHFQRGGPPCPADRVLATRLGAGAVGLIKEGNFGNMVGIVNNEIVPVPLEKVAGKLKRVQPDGSMVCCAKAIGVDFGD